MAQSCKNSSVSGCWVGCGVSFADCLILKQLAQDSQLPWGMGPYSNFFKHQGPLVVVFNVSLCVIPVYGQSPQSSFDMFLFAISEIHKAIYCHFESFR